MKRYFSLFAILLACGSVQAYGDSCDALASNLIRNCGFETGDLTFWTPSPSNQVGNYLGVDAVDALDGRFGAYLASPFSFDFGVGSYAYLSQTPSLTAGQQYRLSYTLAHDTSSNPSATPDNVFFVVLRNTIFLDSIIADEGAFGATRFSFSFTNTVPGSAFLGFEAADVNYYFSLDNVSLVPIPEPASLGFITGGVVILALVARKRLSVQAT